MTAKPCTVCELKPAYARGACKGCYGRMRREGTLDQLRPPRKTGVCAKGHEIAGDNAMRRPDKKMTDGWRYICRTCQGEYNRQWRARRRAEQPPKPVKAQPQPKVKAAKPVPAPKPIRSNLPPGWDKPLAKPKATVIKGTEKEVPPVKPTPDEILAKAANTLRLWWVLEPEVALDLAPMLGLEVAA